MIFLPLLFSNPVLSNIGDFPPDDSSPLSPAPGPREARSPHRAVASAAFARSCLSSYETGLTPLFVTCAFLSASLRLSISNASFVRKRLKFVSIARDRRAQSQGTHRRHSRNTQGPATKMPSQTRSRLSCLPPPRVPQAQRPRTPPHEEEAPTPRDPAVPTARAGTASTEGPLFSRTRRSACWWPVTDVTRGKTGAQGEALSPGRCQHFGGDGSSQSGPLRSRPDTTKARWALR